MTVSAAHPTSLLRTAAVIGVLTAAAVVLPSLPAFADNTFVDDNSSTFERDIEALAAAGITTGCGGDVFCPDRPVTRGEMAALLDRALDLPASDDDRFVDDDDSIFEAEIQALAAAGITTGCRADRFCPDELVTRGQMAAFLTRALGLPRPPDPTPYELDASRTLRPGDRGPAVVALQERLLQLGYWLPAADGDFGSHTHHAVVALQKAAGIARDGIFDAATWQALDAAVRPQPRSSSGTVIEVDRTSQLLLVVTDGDVRQVFDTSTGRPGLETPAGRFRVERQIDGYRDAPLGTLYRPKYFYRGIAMHGYPSVPPSPASHGCVRLTNAAIDWLWEHDTAPIGRAVWVY